MKLNKEKIAFIVIMLLVGFLAYGELFGSPDTPSFNRRKGGRGRATVADVSELETMKAALVDVDEQSWTLSGRNIYRAPKEHVPMPPLNLSAPPRPSMVTSTPQSMPGPDAYSRMGSVGRVIPAVGVELSPRAEEPNRTDELTEGAEIEGDAGDGSGEPISEDTEDAIEEEIIELENKLKGIGVAKEQEEKKKEEKKTRRLKKVLGLRERLAQDAEAKIEKERLERKTMKDEAERERTLDKIHWLTGEIWYGNIENDSVVPAGSEGFDKYTIKLQIDAIRQDTRSSENEIQTKLGDRKLEIEFTRWKDKKWGSKSKLAPLNVRAISFAEGATSGAYTVSKFELERRQISKSDRAAQIALAAKLENIGEFNLAKVHLKGLLDQGGDSLELFRSLALAANHDFDYNIESLAVHNGLKKFPKDAVLMAGAAELYSRLGLEHLATDLFSKAQVLAPRNAQVNARHGRHLTIALDGGRARAVEAKQLLEKAASGRFEFESEKRTVHLDLGEAQLASGNLDAAERAFDQVNTARPDNIRALNGLASVAIARGRIETAREKLKDILERSPETGATYYNLALCAMAEEKWEEARNHFYDAMNADPFLTAKSHCGLGFLYEKIGQPEEAQAAYAAGLEADPADGEVLYWNGRGYLLIGDYQQALDVLRQSLTKLPNQFDILAALSDACFHLQAFDDALKYVDAAMELRPQSPGLLIRKAQTLVRLRRFSDAKKCLDESKQQAASEEVELSLAYYYYLEGNHEEALKRFRTVERSLDRKDRSELASYTRRFSAEIADNLSKKVWSDHFNRVSTGRDLLRGWRSYAPGSGIPISLVDNRVSFNGTQKASDVPSCIFQSRSGREFVSFEAGITSKPKAEPICGIAILTFRKNTGDQNPFVDVNSGGIAYDGLIVGKNREGRLAYRVVERYQLGRWIKTSEPWPVLVDGVAQQVTLGIASEDGKKGTFSVLVNGNAVVTGVEVKGLRRSTKDLQLWAFTQAEIDRRIDVKVDDVRIVTRDTKRK